MELRVKLHLGFLSCTAAVLVAWSSVGVPKPVRLEVDGAATTHQTRQVQVGGFLKQRGVALAPGDAVYPSPNSSIGADNTVRVFRAVPVETAAEARVAGAIHVHDGGRVLDLAVRAETIEGVLSQAGVVLRPGDTTFPEASRPARPGAHVYIDRGKSVTLVVDGEARELNTRVATVEDLIREADLAFTALDRVTPDGSTAVSPGLRVQIVRVNEERHTEHRPLPFQTVYQPDHESEIGQEREVEAGEPGLYRREVLVRREDGREVARTVERETLERTARPRLVSYGTKIIPRYLDTELGAVQYYRTLRVWATWYAPWSAGKPPWSPGYGITSTGMRVGRGIIAVDPRVIPYYTQLYVPGYGLGIAADTGGGVRGHTIDLGFADSDIPDWQTGWVEIYLLGPPPGGPPH